MIVVVSRFRVANGLEDSVRDGFLSRPHHVDDADGFLGIEAFTDRDDPAIFYLYTRWTSLESFERWYGGDDAARSQALVPKGVELEEGFTEVRYLLPIQ